MKMTSRFILLLLGIPFYSHGMSGDGYGYGQAFDPLWFWSRVFNPFQRQRLNYDSSGLPILLPRLKIAEYEAGQSLLEKLPLEIFYKNIAPRLSVKDLQNIAVLSRTCKIMAQFSICHIKIYIGDPINFSKEFGFYYSKIKDLFKNVKAFTLYGRIDSYHLSWLIGSFPLIESLHLSSYNGKDVIIYFLQYLSKSYKHLKMLNLDRSEIGDKGMEVLAKAPFANQLESLNVGSTLITIEGIKELCKPNIFKGLKVLDINYNRVGDDIIEILAQAPFARPLELIDITGTDITKAGRQKLLKLRIAKRVKYLGENRSLPFDFPNSIVADDFGGYKKR